MTDEPLSMALKQLQHAYIKALPEKLEALREAARARDFEAAARIGHQLKGSGRSYGFADLSQIGSNIEQNAMDRRVTMLESLLVELRELIAQLAQASNLGESQ